MLGLAAHNRRLAALVLLEEVHLEICLLECTLLLAAVSAVWVRIPCMAWAVVGAILEVLVLVRLHLLQAPHLLQPLQTVGSVLEVSEMLRRSIRSLDLLLAGSVQVEVLSPMPYHSLLEDSAIDTVQKEELGVEPQQ